MSQDYVLLSDILEERRTIPVKFTKDGIEREVMVTYNPSKFTPELETKLTKMEDEDDAEAAEYILGMLTSLIISWNVKMPPLEEGGPPVDFPPNLENLRTMPYSVLGTLVRTVSTDMIPKGQSARP